MRIVYCLAGTFNSGGMERIVINKANWLAAHGYDVSIVTTEQAGRHDFFPLEGNIIRKDLDIMYSETNNLTPVVKLRERNRRMRMHRRLLEAYLCEWRPDITISTFGNEVSFLYKIKDDSKKIAEIHFSKWYRLQLNRKGLWKWIDKALTWQDQKVLSHYDKFVCLTQEDKSNWGGIHNIAVIPNFIPDVANVPATLADKSMIAVGRLSYQKGYERLVAAWEIVHKQCPDWRLKIYGGGELLDDLRRDIEQRSLQAVITIHAPEADIMARYLASSALVLSSRYEGLPMVLLEAMACGLPLISYTCQCGPRDVIQNEYNGLLVPEGDIEGLAKAIMRVIENQELRSRMGKNALSESRRYLRDAIMPRWVNLFQTIVNG